MKKVKIPALAYSIRTSLFPVRLYDSEGKRVYETRASKRVEIVEVPDNTMFLAHFYQSTRGHRRVTLFILDEVAGWKEYTTYTEENYDLVRGYTEMAKDIEDWFKES